MNCVLFETRLDELLDERLPPGNDAELNEHAEACMHCARLLADHQALLEAIEVLVRPAALGDLAARDLAGSAVAGKALAARILAEVTVAPVSSSGASPRATTSPTAESQRPGGPVQAAAWIAATIAASLLVGLGLMEWRGVGRSGPVAVSKTPDPAPRNTAMQVPAAAGNADFPHPSFTTRSMADVQSLAGLISPQQRTLMEQMTDGLKPVTHSMSAALNALRRTFPGSETPARS
jgi:hypothetical protein